MRMMYVLWRVGKVTAIDSGNTTMASGRLSCVLGSCLDGVHEMEVCTKKERCMLAVWPRALRKEFPIDSHQREPQSDLGFEPRTFRACLAPPSVKVRQHSGGNWQNVRQQK
eukprot:1151914-Pelagomonas_calceolata.AAC.1